MVRPVEDDGAVETALLQKGEIERVIHESLTRPQLAGLAVVVEVFGVGQGYVVAEQVEGLP